MISGIMDNEKKNNPTLTLPTRGGKPDTIRHNGRKEEQPHPNPPHKGRETGYHPAQWTKRRTTPP